MIDTFADKPHCVDGELPHEMRLTWDDYVPEDISFRLCSPCGKTVAKPYESRRDGCYSYVVIPEEKCLCAGRYYLKIMDGCDPCDTLSIELKASCFVRHVESTGNSKTTNIKCGVC